VKIKSVMATGAVQSIGVMAVHGSALITLCAPCTDKCAVRRHEPCEHRRRELGGLDLLIMVLRAYFGAGGERAVDGAQQFNVSLTDRSSGMVESFSFVIGWVNTGKARGRDRDLR
jgi:hypothetical protein